MRLFIGNIVKVIEKTSVAYGLEGEVMDIDKSTVPTVYLVSIKDIPSVTAFYETELELITTLPIGNQIPLGRASLILENQDTPKEAKCDCGGFKVYATTTAEAHSPWCSILLK